MQFITRTQYGVTVKCKCVDTESEMVSVYELTIPGVSKEAWDKSPKKAAKLVRDRLPENLVLISIVEAKETEELYAMPMDDFLRAATKYSNREAFNAAKKGNSGIEAVQE